MPVEQASTLANGWPAPSRWLLTCLSALAGSSGVVPFCGHRSAATGLGLRWELRCGPAPRAPLGCHLQGRPRL